MWPLRVRCQSYNTFNTLELLIGCNVIAVADSFDLNKSARKLLFCFHAMCVRDSPR